MRALSAASFNLFSRRPSRSRWASAEPSFATSPAEEMGDKPRFTPSTFVVDKTPEFESLALRAIADEVGGVRVRQHVNPLSSRNQALVPAPPWAQLFDDATLPLCLDLGCGSGRFLLALAEKEAGAAAPPRNFLGVEIREPLVGRAGV